MKRQWGSRRDTRIRVVVRVMNSFGVMVGIRVNVKPFCSAAKP